ncbi:MAG TPA: ABC transporter ATP-binding protein [Flavobacteriaceae bacterium]|nr:ABC transporter ATP-binding protein [Flavobacteriaceae bacterium]
MEKIKAKYFDLKQFVKLMQFVKPYNKSFYLVMFFAVILSVITTVTPYLLKVVVDDYIIPKDYSGMTLIILLMIIALTVEVLFMVCFTYYSNWLGQKVIKDIRVKIFDKIINLKMSFFDKNSVGRLVTRAVNDIETIASIFSQGLFTIIADFFKMLVILLVMFIISFRLTFVVLLIFPFLIYATRVFQKAMKKAFELVRSEVANLNSFVQERISGIKIVQIFNREKIEENKFNTINIKHRDAWLKTVWINSIFFPIAEISGSICVGLLVWYGGFNNANGIDISIGTLFLFITMSGLLFRPLRQIADRFNTLQMGMVAVDRIFSIFENDSIINETGDIDETNFKGKIDFRNVRFSYISNIEVLKGISFSVKPGETLAIVGPTGSGKTTIINLISRLYNLNSGQINIDDRSINEYKLNCLRSNIGVILQDVFLFADTIHNNVTLFDENISKDEVINAAKELGIHEFIMSLPENYKFNVQERGNTLSAGQKQLIAFMRVLIKNPDILILDEATSSIDSYSEDLIKNATKKITKNKTSIIIAHRLATIEAASTIIYMEDGVILEAGNHYELIELENGRYRKMHQEQFSNTEILD